MNCLSKKHYFYTGETGDMLLYRLFMKLLNRVQCKSQVRMLAIILLCLIPFHSLIGQIPENDTTSILDKIIWTPDTLIRNPLPSRQTGRLSEWPPKPSDSVFLNSSRFGRELNNLLLKLYSDQDERKMQPVINTNLTPYDGMFIRNIEIQRVNMFAASALDTAYTPQTWLEKAATSVHIGTRKKIIARDLLVHPGESLDVFLAAENERLIRDMPYIMDARFLARQVPGEPDSIDLVLLTKDLFPLGFGLEIGRANAGNAGIWYNNTFGYGHQVLTSIYWDGKYSPLFGYRVLYGIPNISGSYFSSELEYINRWNTRTSRIRVIRDFKTLGFKYAGGAEFESSKLKRDIIVPDSTIPLVNWRFTSYDLWVGRMIVLRNSNPKGVHSGLFISGRAYNKEFYEGPKISEHFFYNFQDKTQLLFSAGYARQGFRKDNMIYTFDRTEDVPFGYLFGLTSGMEWGQYQNRPYVEISGSFGKYFRNSGYLFGRMEYGTFVHDGSLEQGVFRAQLNGFTRLQNWKRFQFRHFGKLTYVNGINRFPEEFTTLERIGGIEGLASPSLRGNEKIVLNLESVAFSPYRIFGFHFAFFGSVDLGLIKRENIRLEQSSLHTGLNLGVRIRNDQLVFDTFEIKFSLYPGHPSDANPTYFEILTVPRLRLNRLFPDKPAVIDYL